MPATAKDFVKALNIFITESNVKRLISLKKGEVMGKRFIYCPSWVGRMWIFKKMLSWNEMRLGFAGNLSSFDQCL